MDSSRIHAAFLSVLILMLFGAVAWWYGAHGIVSERERSFDAELQMDLESVLDMEEAPPPLIELL